VTISIGVATASGGTRTTPADLVALTDRNLNAAKNQGHNRVEASAVPDAGMGNTSHRAG
jgi:GGDEF domain-containing protein